MGVSLFTVYIKERLRHRMLKLAGKCVADRFGVALGDSFLLRLYIHYVE